MAEKIYQRTKIKPVDVFQLGSKRFVICYAKTVQSDLWMKHPDKEYVGRYNSGVFYNELVDDLTALVR